MDETGPRAFHTTRWSVVLAAGRADGSPEARDALERLARVYWYPLFLYARRRGAGPEEARDLVQSLFARLLERGDLARVDPARGRFRAYLLACARNLLADERERAAALRRGGGRQALSFDAGEADERLALEPADEATPERAFDRAWAREVLGRALERLRGEYAADGRAAIFEALRSELVAEDEPASGAELAARLGTSEGAARVAVHRLRSRYRRHLRAEIRETLADPRDVEDEVRHLFEALGGA